MVSINSAIRAINGIAKEAFGYDEEEEDRKKQRSGIDGMQKLFDSSEKQWAESKEDTETPIVKEDDSSVDNVQTSTQSQINSDFLREVEGFETTAYVPTRDGEVLGHSGPSVGSGIDLGQWNKKSLKEAGVSESIVSKVEPYLGKQGNSAVSYLEENPLTLEQAEAEEITEKIERKAIKDVSSSYNTASDLAWDELTTSQKTAITSVAFQYGELSSAAPDFWGQVTSGDWEGAVKELRNFTESGKYQNRREKEAKLIEKSIDKRADNA